MDESSVGTRREGQHGIGSQNLAIGRVVQREGSAVTSVRIRFVSTAIYGRPQAVA